MNLRQKKALTLIESMVSILLLGAFICSFLGAFFVSRLSTLRAQHRVVAMNIIREYMEREIEAGYDGGDTDEQDYYATVVPEELPKIITVDNKEYALNTDPAFPDNIYQDHDASILLSYENRNYKIIGFVVSWTEDFLGGRTGPTCSERSTAYVFDHG